MPPGVCTIRRKLPVTPPNSGRPGVKQRSDTAPSSGPSWRFMRAVLYRGGGSARRGEGVGSYLPPLQVGYLILQVSVACIRVRRNSRSAAAVFRASGVSGGIRPSGGSTISDVRAPVRFLDKNTWL